MSAHKDAIGALLSTGLAKHHRANQAARLKVEQVFGTPVLLSGLASLILLKPEQSIINSYHRNTLQKLLNLLPSTPHPVIYFLAGSLPGEALLHLRQLSLLGMVTRLQGSQLHSHAKDVYTMRGSSWSWFHQVREVCLTYQLPHPLKLLNNPLGKEAFKKLVKKHVVNYWEIKLRSDAAPLSSLMYFKPEFMSLTRPHPLLVTAGASPYEVTKAGVQALLLSGRYRTELLSSNWSSNPEGFCLCPSCKDKNIVEDVEHILLHCGSLAHTREGLVKFTLNYSKSVPLISDTMLSLTSPSNPLYFQFLLDCSVIPEIIKHVQRQGVQVLEHFFKISRTWCYSMHRERLKLLGRWRSF